MTLSSKEHYRYILFREVQLEQGSPDNGVLVFIMLNPSTANAEKNDPTIRKCLGFAKDWGYGRLEVVNLFAYRSPEPRDLARAEGTDITGGRHNHDAIQEAVQNANLVVCAWGGASSLPARFKKGALKNRSKEVLDLIKAQGKQPYTISAKLTASGQPQHPRSLKFPDDTTPKLWEESRWPCD